MNIIKRSILLITEYEELVSYGTYLGDLVESCLMLPFQISDIRPQTDDERFMKEALKEAIKAYEAKEVPVGAVLVQDGRVLSKGHNQVELLRDATAHAEMLCLTSGSSFLENWRLKGCVIYSTLEPCVMCAGAMLLSRVDRLVWGAPDLRHGANGSWVDLFEQKHPTHCFEITKGVLGSYSAALMQSFFVSRREK